MGLKHIPQTFEIDSEDELLFALAKYFQELGFDRDELSFQDYFSIRLGHNVIDVGKHRDHLTGRSDLLLIRDGRPLAVVETKAPSHNLTQEDAWQAISYARLLQQMAPLAILTNGIETQVFDPLSPVLKRIENPTDSLWQQGMPSINEDLRFEATRRLIGVNPETLRSFCMKQLDVALEDLRGPINESRTYVPEIYLPRQEPMDDFRDWLSSDLPCFAVVGDADIGKTNLMCALAESLLENNLVLFYSAARLVDNLQSTLVNDFIWEFQREKHISFIVDRLDEIASKHYKTLVIFVDGLDEYPGNKAILKAEFLDFASRIKNRSVKLCMSCKSFDWRWFVIDKDRTYNKLAKSVYPARDSVHRPSSPTEPKETEVGTWLVPFTESELDEVFVKYKKAFVLRGELHGTTRTECRTPLMLRLVAETYAGRDTALPSEISAIGLFDAYWKQKFSLIEQNILAEEILQQCAAKLIYSGKQSIERSVLLGDMARSDGVDSAYRDLIRLGFLQVTIDARGFEQLSFRYQKLRSFVFTIKFAKWPVQDSSETTEAILNLLGTPNALKLEAVEFYLVSVDRGETSLLTELALNDLSLFVQLIEVISLKSSPLEKKSNAFGIEWNNMPIHIPG